MKNYSNINRNNFVLKILLFLFFITYDVFSQTFTDSNLPIFVITTDIDPNTGQPIEIPDDPRVLGTIKIIKRPDGTRNYLTDVTNTAFLNYSGRINIEIRGSTSQDLPKKPYGLTTLLADNITSTNVSILGMPAENDWILNALAYDNSYMRDHLSYYLSRQTGNYAVRTNYCEVVVNGDYKGLYLFQEKLKADTNRINVMKILTTDTANEALTGGYITKADKTTGGDPIAWQMNPNVGIPVTYIHELPKVTDVTTQQNNYISEIFFGLDTNSNNTNLQTGYPSIIDVPSFVDFMVINELASNVDAYQYSTYFHKDRVGKLRAGPVWDLNLSFGNDLPGVFPNRSVTNQWQFLNGDNVGSKFWLNLYNNTTYKCYMSKRWNDLIQTGQTLNQTIINTFIDATALLITESADRDAQKWFSSTANLTPKVTFIKNFITARTTWMTNNLGSFSACNAVITPSLVISKIHYNPVSDGAFTSNNQEFIEITNTGTTTISLSGIYLKELGVSYHFPFNSSVSSGQKIYLASNLATFQSKYGFAGNGQFYRNLSNKSQKIVLADAFGNTIDSVEYLDISPWPISADGTGPYLQLTNNSLDNSLGSNWTTSSSSLGIPNFDSLSTIILFPNPTNTILNLISEKQLDKIEVFDSNNRLLFKTIPQTTNQIIDCRAFESGIYFVKLFDGKNNTTKKFIKN